MSKKIILKSKKGLITILSEKTVDHIVKEWYTNGMMADIFQNEGGYELDEVLDDIYSDEFEIKTIKNGK